MSLVAISTATIQVHAGGAQTFTITQLVLEGDSVDGVGLVTRIDYLAVNDSGQWIVEADTNAGTDVDSVLIKDGTLFLREGGALALPIGASIGSFDSVNLNNAGLSGWNFFLDGTKDIFDDSGIYLNANLVLQEGTISTSKDFGPGTPYIGFFESAINNNSPAQILLMASVDDPNIASSVDRALGVMTEEGFLFEAIIAGQDGISFSDNGRYMAFEADLPGGLNGAFLIDFGELNNCPWDLNGSGIVDTSDLLAVFAQWGTDGPADFNESGTVDKGDLLILLANWGPCP